MNFGRSPRAPFGVSFSRYVLRSDARRATASAGARQLVIEQLEVGRALHVGWPTQA